MALLLQLPHWSSQFCASPNHKHYCSQRRRCIKIEAYSSVSSGSNANTSLANEGFLMGPFKEGELRKPRWTGDEPLSRFISALISIKPLFSLMTLAARQVLINSAEKNGVPWRQISAQYLSPGVYAEKDLLEDKSIAYPDYYVQKFHCYSDGNLSWKAASEVEPATASMTIRAIPAARTLEEATEVLRGNWLKAIEDHHSCHSGGSEIKDILDVGCAVGVSTRCLADWFMSARVTGLDLSPYFLAVAQYKEKQQAATGLTRRNPVHWIHAKGEDTGLAAASFDLISLAFVIHECPQHATVGLLKEAFRLLRPGGTVALIDNSPRSKIIQDLPPPIFTLMKASEPWMDEYYTMDLEEVMQEVGFRNVKSILTDPRHRTTTGTVLL